MEREEEDVQWYSKWGTLFHNSHKGPIVTEDGGKDDEGQDG